MCVFYVRLPQMIIYLPVRETNLFCRLKKSLVHNLGENAEISNGNHNKNFCFFDTLYITSQNMDCCLISK